MGEILLELKDIRKSFFGTEVLHGVNLTVKKGSIHGLVGENGAGKSTLMNIIGGVLKPDCGIMTLNGERYSPETPKDACESKISFVHQELNLFSNLTVAENLFIENLPVGAFKQVRYQYMAEQTLKYMEKFQINVSPKTKVETLAMGVRQSIEIAKALIISANLIIFDEPTTSLTQIEKERLFSIIRDLKKHGVTVIYISHILEDVLELCDEISILRDGSQVANICSEQTCRDEIISFMVGRKLEKLYPTVDKTIGTEILRCDHIGSGNLVKDAGLTLHRGEILGIFGLMGAGRTEFVRALFGLDRVDRGLIEYKGNDFTRHTPRQAIAKGFAFVSEDRRSEGLLMPKPVEDNLLLVHLPELTNCAGVVNVLKGSKLCDESITKLQIKVTNKKTQLVCNLSGGNQQKVVFGKWLMNKPEVLILDEPTRGVDVGAKYEIYTLINDLAKRQSAVLVVSSEMEELMGICDRILIMCEGRIVAEQKRADFNPKSIMEMAIAGAR